MKLPKKYEYLTSVNIPTIQTALKYYGVREIKGEQNHPTIMGWVKALARKFPRLPRVYVNDDRAWCALFAGNVLNECGYRLIRGKSPLWSRNWLTFGEKAGVPSLGDVLIFARGTGGHIGFYVGEDKSCYHVLGGNQDNEVNIVRINKNRILDVRCPPYTKTPPDRRPVRLAARGRITTNEL